MGDLAGALRTRAQEARRNLSQARADGDTYGIDVFTAELEDLKRRAAAHGITLPATVDQVSLDAAAAAAPEAVTDVRPDAAAGEG